MGYLYRLDFPNGKSYIGVTYKTPMARFKEHSKNAKAGGKPRLCAAWRKYGAPLLVTLAQIEDDELNSTEMRAIAAFGTKIPNGYNMTDGGDGVKGHRHSEAARLKMSIAGKGRKKTPEHRAKIAAANTGRTLSPESIEKTASKLRGRKLSAEHIEKMRAANIGKTISAEQRAKISVANTGKVRSEESKAKVSRANKGRKHPPRKPISEELRARFVEIAKNRAPRKRTPGGQFC